MPKDEKRVLHIEEFMELPPDEKAKYINRYYPDGKALPGYCEYHDLDVKEYDMSKEYFNRPGSFWECEECGASLVALGKAMGTGDTHDPMFCFDSYRKINEDSDFIPHDLLDKKEWSPIKEDEPLITMEQIRFFVDSDKTHSEFSRQKQIDTIVRLLALMKIKVGGLIQIGSQRKGISFSVTVTGRLLATDLNSAKEMVKEEMMKSLNENFDGYDIDGFMTETWDEQ